MDEFFYSVELGLRVIIRNSTIIQQLVRILKEKDF